MKKLILTAVSLAAFTSMPAFAQSAAGAQLSVDQVTSDITLAREAYSRVHPGYTRYAKAADMEAAWTGIITEAKAKEGLTSGEFYLAVQKVLTLIRCDHTKAELPKALRQERNETPVYLPLRWQLVDQRALITLPVEALGLNVGDEILSINGRPLAAMIAEVESYIPYDGYTKWSRAGGVGESLEFMGGAVDHFGALLWDISPTATVEIKAVSGEVKTVQMERVTFDSWKTLGDAKASVRNFKDAVSYQRIGENAGYLKIDSFVNYRDPVKPDTLFRPIFKSIQAEGRDYLILDLRQNGGGSSDARMSLTANLLSEPLKAKKDMRVATLNLDGLRDHMSTWDKRALKPNPLGFKKNKDGTYSLRSFIDEDLRTLKPSKYAFNGKLIVLTSSTNSSGSTSLAATLKSHRDATLIGGRTGGSAEGPTAGLLFTLTLPESGIRTRVPFFRYYNNVKVFEPGLGMTPDINAPMTADAFLEGRDPAYDAALAFIEGKVE
ncbi:MAG: S41 family peptidase [Hellea sp.]